MYKFFAKKYIRKTIIIVDSGNSFCQNVTYGLLLSHLIKLNGGIMSENLDRQALREEALKDMHDGAVTEDYQADLDVVRNQLSTSMATEVICYLRYMDHYFKAKSLGENVIANEFKEHALQEMDHALTLAERLSQLGGVPDFNPASCIEKSHVDFVKGINMEQMIKENLLAERIAIKCYRQFIEKISDTDATTRLLIEKILMTEEEHADEILDFVSELSC